MLDPVAAQILLDRVALVPLEGAALRRFAMQALSELPGYDWCGVYRLEGRVLHLDEYVGDPTDHTEIPEGMGVCGTAIAENRNQVVADVGELTNYLSCSLKTKSEIVVLIRDEKGVILGQIDIDGHTAGAFDGEDEALLERLAEFLAARW